MPCLNTYLQAWRAPNGPKQIHTKSLWLLPRPASPFEGSKPTHFYFAFLPLLWTQWKIVTQKKRPWRAPPGPKVHLSLQHTGQTASLKYTHLPMFIHCRPLESKYNVECKGLKPPLFHQLTKSPTVGSFFSLWYFQSSTHKKELVLDAFP